MQPQLQRESQPQQRLKKFIRQPDRLTQRQLTDKGLEAVAIVERYRFLPTSLLVRLMPGGQRNNYRHLQTLFHKGLISRFALPKFGGPGEFMYYLDQTDSLRLLTEAGLLELTPDEHTRRQEIIRTNREKNYANLHRDPDVQGKLLFIHHELGISRFHAMLELACNKLAGRVELTTWLQGPQLWNQIEVPKTRKLRVDPDTGQTIWEELDKTETLPHRPDAFFTLRFPGNPPDRQHSHFLYEHDRATENTTRIKQKLRAHYHFIVKHTRQRQQPYNVHAIRAVLIETTTSQWAHNLREAAKENIVSPRSSPLFWFTTSQLFTKPIQNGSARPIPTYLHQPEVIFKRIWASPVEDTFLNLAD